MSVKIGDTAPDFSLPDQNGNLFHLHNFIGKEHIVIYFYPQDETPGCVAEACSFRDHVAGFEGYNCRVVGISKDSVSSHAKFAEHYHLPFTLLSDEHNLVRKQFGVKPTLFGLLPGRKTFLINKQGVITHVFNYQLKARQHVSDALKALNNE
jgi:thioredoxin-dependent peroxiredoxin